MLTTCLRLFPHKRLFRQAAHYDNYNCGVILTVASGGCSHYKRRKEDIVIRPHREVVGVDGWVDKTLDINMINSCLFFPFLTAQ